MWCPSWDDGIGEPGPVPSASFWSTSRYGRLCVGWLSDPVSNADLKKCLIRLTKAIQEATKTETVSPGAEKTVLNGYILRSINFCLI